jgi:hypothetical protein
MASIVRAIKSRKIRWTACVIHERDDKCMQIIQQPERKRQLGRPRCRWEGNIKMDIKEKGVMMWTSHIWLR